MVDVNTGEWIAFESCDTYRAHLNAGLERTGLNAFSEEQWATFMTLSEEEQAEYRRKEYREVWQAYKRLLRPPPQMEVDWLPDIAVAREIRSDPSKRGFIDEKSTSGIFGTIASTMFLSVPTNVRDAAQRKTDPRQ